MARSILLVATVVLLSGCAVTPPLPPFPNDHPASPNATAAPETANSETLRIRPRGEGPAGLAGERHLPRADLEQHDPTSELQPSSRPKDRSSIYACPMHPEIQQPGPGACPKCGMPLMKPGDAR